MILQKDEKREKGLRLSFRVAGISFSEVLFPVGTVHRTDRYKNASFP
jgi:hypothetical protein